MLSAIKWLLGLCKHDWLIEKYGNIQNTYESLSTTTYNFDYYLIRCKKCRKIKWIKIK